MALRLRGCLKTTLLLLLALSDGRPPWIPVASRVGYFCRYLSGACFATHHLLSLLAATKDLPTAYWLPCPRR